MHRAMRFIIGRRECFTLSGLCGLQNGFVSSGPIIGGRVLVLCKLREAYPVAS